MVIHDNYALTSPLLYSSTHTSTNECVIGNKQIQICGGLKNIGNQHIIFIILVWTCCELNQKALHKKYSTKTHRVR